MSTATKTASEATPRPWAVGEQVLHQNILQRDVLGGNCEKWGGGYIATVAEADAELIVRTVNSFDALVDALANLICRRCENRIGWTGAPQTYGDWRTCPTCKSARAALTLATGGRQ